MPIPCGSPFSGETTCSCAPYYVRWNVIASRSSSGHGPLDQELVKLLSLLAAFNDRLERWNTAGSPALAEQIAADVEALKECHRGIEGVIEDKVKSLEQHPESTAVDALLNTPLLSAPMRNRLLAAHDRVADALPGDIPARTPRLPMLGPWINSIRQQAEIERRLALLASPELRLASLDDGSVPANDTLTESQFWKTYGQFGQELGEFYRNLPENIRTTLASGDPGAGDRCDRYLRLVDARDAASVPDEVLNVVLPHLPPTPPAPGLAVRAQSPGEADADGQYSIQLWIDKKDLPASHGVITFEYSRAELVLTSSDGKRTIEPDERLPADLRSSRTQLVYRARAQTQTGGETTVKISVRCGEKSQECQIRLSLPQPDAVTLRAYRLVGKLDGSTDRRMEKEVTLQFDKLAPKLLEPFPNRPTTYSFEMVNGSGLGKNLLVRIYALPEWFWDRNMNCRQACEILERSGILLGESGVELAQLRTSQKIVFPAVKSPPAKKADDGAAEKPEGKKAPEKLKIDVTHGMAFVVYDAKRKEPEPKWIAVFAFSPLRPSRYLDPTAQYNSDEGKLEIEVALAADRDIPSCSKAEPIRLTMAVRDAAGRAVNVLPQGGTGLRGQTKALLFPARPHDALYAPIRSVPGHLYQVELNVDDYPRAFLYEVGLQKVTNQRDLWRIQITDPQREPVKALQPLETLPMKFRVDAPEDSFFFGGGHAPAADVVQVDIFDEQHPETARRTRFYSDRQVQVGLQESDADGELKVFARTDDFATNVDAHGLENVVAKIRAQLLHDGQPKDEDSLRVILDGGAPEFDLAPVSDKVIKGSDIQIVANVTRTLSDMSKFEFGFQGDVEKQFQGKTKSIEPRGRSASFVLPTKELDPGEYTVLVRGENRAGNADFRSVKVTVVEPPPPPSEKPAATAITIHGTVKWLDGSAAAGVDVSIEKPARSAVTDEQGKFTFSDLPRDAYVVKAKGSAGGIRASGEAKADPGSRDTVNVQISLSSLNR